MAFKLIVAISGCVLLLRILGEDSMVTENPNLELIQRFVNLKLKEEPETRNLAELINLITVLHGDLREG